MIAESLLKILVCPESHQPLKIAEEALVQELNRKIKAGQLADRGGRPVGDLLEGGLVREDGKFLYPIRGNIPVMLIDEAIPLGG